MPDEPPRLFLSYGVRDASDIAERLHRDLMERGYQVWQDVNRIRAGRPWDEEVQTGLRNSQVMLALLSRTRCAGLGMRAIRGGLTKGEIKYDSAAFGAPPCVPMSQLDPFSAFRESSAIPTLGSSSSFCTSCLIVT